MTGRSDITAGAAKIYASGLKLGKEISDMIVGTVTEYATDIENFVNRKHELLDVDAKFLFFFAIAVELNFVSAAWQEQKTTDIIDEIAHIASQHFEFTSSSMKTESELAIERKTFRESLYKMYENLQSSWDLWKKDRTPTEKEEFIFIFFLYYLRRVYPPVGSFLIGTGKNLPLFASLHRQFGLKMIPPQFQQPDPAPIDPPLPPS